MNNKHIGRFKQHYIWRFNRLSIVVLLVLLSACSSKVTVVADIPIPLVEKAPLNVHMSYTDEFKNYVYTESEKKRALNSLDFALAQEEMFNTIFGQLTTLVDIQSPIKDLTIEPEILDFQYTAPAETKLKQYEIWIKYRLKIRDHADEKIADWTIKGYGKTPTALLTSATKAFNSATNIALRDVGAQLATRFTGQRKIKALINANGVEQTSVTPAVVADLQEGQPEAQDAKQKVNEAVNERIESNTAELQSESSAVDQTEITKGENDE